MASELKCTVCNKVVEYPKFDCTAQPGRHTVEEKTYYHLGGQHVQSIRDRGLFAPLVILQAAYDRVDPDTQEPYRTEAVQVQFNNGNYSTTDSREQWFLDRRKDILQGPEGLEAWQKIYLTPEKQKRIAEDKLGALNRQIKEANDLLAATKAQKQQPAGARA
jgi:hypothetical protein